MERRFFPGSISHRAWRPGRPFSTSGSQCWAVATNYVNDNDLVPRTAEPLTCKVSFHAPLHPVTKCCHLLHRGRVWEGKWLTQCHPDKWLQLDTSMAAKATVRFRFFELDFVSGCNNNRVSSDGLGVGPITVGKCWCPSWSMRIIILSQCLQRNKSPTYV